MLLRWAWLCVVTVRGAGAVTNASSSVAHAKALMKARPPSMYNWTAAMQRMYDTLGDSLRAVENDAEAAFRAALEDKEHTVWIIEGKIYVEKAFLGTMKPELHLRLMRAVVGNAKKLGDQTTLSRVGSGISVYAIESSASGSHHCHRYLPTFVIAKKRGTSQCGVMIPNPYFENPYGQWRKDFERLLKVGAKNDWHQRNPRVFWRGAVRGHPDDDCARDAGNFARLSASALTIRYPRLFDVRPTSCDARKKHDCDLLYDVNPDEEKAAEKNCRGHRGNYVPHIKFADFRYVLDLPGSTSGSYSRNLNHLWLLGAIVLIWTGPLLDDHGAAQWYTPALLDGHTHLQVDRHSAPLFAEALAHESPKLRDYLRRNARDVAEKLLCPDCIVLYLMHVLHSIRLHLPDLFTLLNAPPGSPIAKKRHEILHDHDRCAKLKLVQVVADAHTRRHSRSIENWNVVVHPLKGSACALLDRGSHHHNLLSSIETPASQEPHHHYHLSQQQQQQRQRHDQPPPPVRKKSSVERLIRRSP